MIKEEYDVKEEYVNSNSGKPQSEPNISKDSSQNNTSAQQQQQHQ